MGKLTLIGPRPVSLFELLFCDECCVSFRLCCSHQHTRCSGTEENRCWCSCFGCNRETNP